MRGQFKGGAIKELVWKCATRTTVEDFNEAMEQLREEDFGAYNYLKEIHPRHWSRSHFTGRAICDLLLNNLCEVFNSKLVDGRDKPIISCLEYIREYLMKRIVIVQKVIDKCNGPLTPTATQIFEGIKKAANRYSATWNGGDRFQVKDALLDQQIVDLRLRTCTCRGWELNGFPCKHAVASIWDMALNSVDVGVPEDWVNPLYRLETWKEVYAFKVEPVSGYTSWPKSECPTKLLPPYHKTQIGRPKKKRNKSALETQPMVKNGKLSRAGKTITCRKCGTKGHNSKHCKSQTGPSQQSASQTCPGSSQGVTQVGASQGVTQVAEGSSGAGVKRQKIACAGSSPAGASQTGPSQVNLGTQ